MLDQHTLLLYLPAMLAITLAPGADTLFVVASAVRSGVRGGVLAACGVISGGVVHIGLATMGLSALILKSAFAFTVLKYFGAAYLIYLGVRTLLSRDGGNQKHFGAARAARTSSLFAQGFVTNVTNPKVALFVVAFFPQFISATRGPVWMQMLELGVLWYVAGLIWLVTVGVIVGRARRWVSPSTAFHAALKYVSASILIALGLRVALPDHR